MEHRTHMARRRATFATNLRVAMLAKGMSQSDLARAVWQETRKDKNGYQQPVGKDRINAYVNGKVFPRDDTLAKIASALDTTPEQLLGEQAEDAQAQPLLGGKLVITIEWKP